MVSNRWRSRCRLRGRTGLVSTYAVRNAINLYPRWNGASVKNIQRVVSKGRRRRSLNRVKRAIERAVRSGSVKPPKGWTGFRGLDKKKRRGRPPQHARRGRPATNARRGRPPQRLPKKPGQRVARYSVIRRMMKRRLAARGRQGTWKKGRPVNRKHTYRYGGATARRLYSGRGRPLASGCGRHPSKRPNLRGFYRGGRNGRYRGRGSSRYKPHNYMKYRRANGNNSSPANASDNYGTGEAGSDATVSLWHTCVIQ